MVFEWWLEDYVSLWAFLLLGRTGGVAWLRAPEQIVDYYLLGGEDPIMTNCYTPNDKDDI